MQRLSTAMALGLCRENSRYRETTKSEHCNVFINYRRIDTNKNVAGLLYDHFSRLNLRPFLDSKSMKPGDKLFKKIDAAIRNCKVGVAVFSPNYCDSYFCLHEFCMILKCRKKVIPIYVDVKPSELWVLDNERCPAKELFRFREAIEEAKNTVGLTFDSSNGDWSELLNNASDAVIQNLIEVEGERCWAPKIKTNYTRHRVLRGSPKLSTSTQRNRNYND